MAQFQNLTRLQAKIARLRQDTEGDVLAGLILAGNAIATAQRRLAPVRTGELRDSIKVNASGASPAHAAFQGSGGASVVGAPGARSRVTISAGNSRVRYAHLVEFGTRPHSIEPQNAEALQIAENRFAEKVDHPGARAQPFFYPGYRATRRRARAIISKAVRDSVKRAVK